MDHPEDGESLGVDGEIALARGLIIAGEYSHGVRHLGFAAALDPTNLEVMALLDRVADDLGELAADAVEPAQPDGWWSGEAAVRAWLLHRIGRVAEGVDLLLQVVANDAERPWSSWFSTWIRIDPALPIDAARMVTTCAALIQPMVDRAPPEAQEATFEDVADLVELACAQHPLDAVLHSIGSGLVRRTGRDAAAVRLAERGERLEPTMTSACMLGYAYRDSGQLERAVEAFAAASERAPDDPAPRLDAVDCLAMLGAWDRAATWASGAWELASESPKAAARALYTRYRAAGDPAVALELLDWVEGRMARDEAPAEAGEMGDAIRIADTAASELPWLGHVPGFVNAAVSGARQIHERGERLTGPVAVKMSAPEAPSALIALSHLVDGALNVVTERIPSPDPRLPRRPVATAAWRLDGDVLRPAVRVPSAAAYGAMRISGAPWYRLSTAVADAAAVAGADVTELELVALAAHPHPGPRAVAPWDWVRCWQVVCCLALAARGATTILTDLADGPEDWICDAALAGLMDLARRRPDLRAQVLQFATGHVLESSRRTETLDLPHFGSECDLFALLPGRSDADAAAVARMKERWLASYG